MNLELTQVPGVLVDRVVGVDDHGFPLVGANLDEARAAQVVWITDAPDWSRCVGLRVVVAHEDGHEERPIILGLLDPPPPPRAKVAPKPKILRVESERELVIECGKSKIALRADGRIEIRGGHLISRSSGPNKIKGGSVHIN